MTKDATMITDTPKWIASQTDILAEDWVLLQ